jgi:hypothetical protein
MKVSLRLPIRVTLCTMKTKFLKNLLMQFVFIDLATGWKSMRITIFQENDIAVHMKLVFPIQNK